MDLGTLSKYRVVFLCGAPGAGKDTFARRVLQAAARPAEWRLEKMAGLLDEMTRPMFPSEIAFRLYRETMKEAPCQWLGGMSLRRYYQRLSEEWIKPMFGPDAFGHRMARLVQADLDAGAHTVIITDSGFREEAEPVLQAIGAHNCLQIRVHREGKTFAGDTRGWWSAPGLRVIEVDNLGERWPVRSARKWHETGN